jgi:Zn-dependent M16 (insulinase) family peptidase
MEAVVVHNGHRLAISLASRNFSASRYLSEIWNGVHQLQAIKDFTREMTEDKLCSIGEKLAQIGKAILKPGSLDMALIGEETALTKAGDRAKILNEKKIEDLHKITDLDIIGDEKDLPREGWSTSTAVSFVAQTFKAARMNHKDAPALAVISKLLRSLYLHREIREKGGAYGGFAVYNPEDGLFGLGSYRDPHIVGTLKVYDHVRDFLMSNKYEEDDIKEAILQVCSEIDKPDPPGPSARKAFFRSIVSLTDEMRMAYKKNLLSVRLNQVREVAEKYFTAGNEDKGVAVISGKEKLEQANQAMSTAPLRLYHI